MTGKLLSIRADFVIDGADSTHQDHLVQAVKDFVDGYQTGYRQSFRRPVYG